MDGTDRLPRNVANYRSTLRNIPEERRSHVAVMIFLYMIFLLPWYLSNNDLQCPDGALQYAVSFLAGGGVGEVGGRIYWVW